jgi:hypothetical protein
MPTDYNAYKNRDLLEPWTRNYKGKKGNKKFRGSLHVRVG